MVNARGDVAKLQVEIGKQDLTAFQAQTQYEIEKAKLLSNWYKVTADTAIENNRVQIQAAEVDVGLFGTTADMVAKLAHSNAQTYASLASSAMSGMNSLAASTEAL